eukprot:SAG31_NODE_2900_length_4934_cov_2.001448_6_plen_123_part_00
MNSFGGGCYTDGDLKKIFDRLDADGEGGVDEDEFLLFMASHYAPLTIDEECDFLFEMIDEDGSGAIDHVELMAFLLGWWQVLWPVEAFSLMIELLIRVQSLKWNACLLCSQLGLCLQCRGCQ